MPEKANQSGRISWSHTAVRSQTIEEYKADHGGKRPKFEASTTGKHLRILTGANVTRKREWTFKGMALGFWGGLKIIYQKVRVLPAGTERLRRNAVLTAGQKFDGGINKLVEDMAKGEDLSQESWGKMRFKKRMAALREQAGILKEKGGLSDKEIAERFRINLMESLRVVQKEAEPKKYKTVLSQITKDILPKFEELVGSPAKDKNITNKDNKVVADNIDAIGLENSEEFEKQQTFDRSVVVAALRDVKTFGCDKKKYEDFGGSHLLHDAFDGDPDAMQAFDNDPEAYRSFTGNQKTYKEWGGCGPLYKRFGGNPEELKGKKGAAALCDWLDETYGEGTGAAFLEKHPDYRKGVTGDGALSRLGKAIQNELQGYWGSSSYTGLDLTVDNVIDGTNDKLKSSFKNFLKGAETGTAVGKGPTLQWLRDLETLGETAGGLPEDTLRKKIRELAERTVTPNSGSMSAGLDDNKDDIKDDIEFDQKYATEADQTPDVSVSPEAKKQFQREIATQAGYELDKKNPTFAESLDDLKQLNEKQLLSVLNIGFAQADAELRDTLGTPLEEFENTCVAENKNGKRNLFIGGLIDRTYRRHNDDSIGDKDDDSFGYQFVMRRRENKRNEDLDDQRDRTKIDGQDLRIIEKELYAEGYVRAGTDQEINKDVEPSDSHQTLSINLDSLLLDNYIELDNDIKNDLDTAEPEKTIPLGNHKMAWDWKFHNNVLTNDETKKLSLDLTKAGNENVKANENRKDDASYSEDFAIDIENGIVQVATMGQSGSNARQIQSPTDLTKGDVRIRPQDLAFVTGALSSVSIVSDLLPGNVTFLKGQQNAFNHPENAKQVRYGTDLRYNNISIEVRHGFDRKPSGRYIANVILRAEFDQMRLSDGSTVAADPDSEVSVHLVCNINCTDGGAVTVTGASFGYQAKAAPPANNKSAPAEPVVEPDASPELSDVDLDGDGKK